MNAYNYAPFGLNTANGYTPQYNAAQYYQLPQNQYQPAQQTSDQIKWVQGDAGAKAYLVAPGSSILLMDSDSPRFFIKSADTSGIPSLRIFKYEEQSAVSPNTPMSGEQYVTRGEYDKLLLRCDELAQRVEQLTAASVAKKAAKKSAAGGDVDEQ